MKSISRRKFVKYSALTTGFSLGKIPLWAKNLADLSTPEDNILVIIQMFGGNDGLNTIIPADDDLYYSRFRPKISIPKNKTIRIDQTNSYLHPALGSGKNNGLAGLHKDGYLVSIQGVGYPNPNLSHFRSTDIWLSGRVPENDQTIIDSGFLGQLFENANNTSDHPNFINIGSSASLLFQTGLFNAGISVNDPKEFYESGKNILSGENFITGNSRFSQEHNYLLELGIKSNKYSKIVNDAFSKGKNLFDYNKDKLGDELKLVARLISGGLKSKVYLVNIDGFDTHASQGGIEGKHASLLKSISESVSWFMADIRGQKLEKNVLGMTVTEFGRRPKENESLGTDHGAAGVMFVFGEAVNGKVYGKPFGFNDLDKNGDFKYQFDFRSVYQEIMKKWMGAEDSNTSSILSGKFDYINGGILKTVGGTLLQNEPIGKSTLYPNPIPTESANLEFTLFQPSEVTIRITDYMGRTFPIFENIPLPSGNHNLPLRLSLNPGNYILSLIYGKNTQSFKFQKL